MSAGLAAVWARSERMVGRWVAGEFVVVPLRNRAADLDAIYNLNKVAAYIWERLDGSASGHEVVRAVASRFEVSEKEAAADYLKLVEELRSIDAVVPAEPVKV